MLELRPNCEHCDRDLPPDAIWRAWTTPALLMQWFCPRPWSVVECDIDLRPGGVFRFGGTTAAA